MKRYTNFLAYIFDWVGEVFEHLSPAMFRTLAGLLPYLSPLPVAWLTSHSATRFLGFPPSISVILVIVVEGIGLWVTTEAVDSVVVFVRSRNAKTLLLVMMFLVVIAFYIALLISLNVSLERAVGHVEPIYSWILMLICFLPLITGVMNGYRKVSLETKTEIQIAKERQMEIEEKRHQEKRSDRMERFKIRHGVNQVYQQTTAGIQYKRGDWRTLTTDEKHEVIHVLSIDEIMKKYQVGRSTAFAWKSKKI